MTEQMAKECIQGKLDCMKTCDVFDCKNTDECDNCIYCYSQGNFGEQKKAFETAIQALEEIQQYKAIGTVEELQALKDKSVAKKPIYKFQYEDGRKFHDCPRCGSYVTHAYEQDHVEYCNCCGQHLDWE